MHMVRRTLVIAAGIAVLLTGLFLLRPGSPRPSELFSLSDFVMDTFATIRVPYGHEESARRAFAELVRMEGIFDRFDPSSQVSRVNGAAGGWVEVGPELIEVLTLVDELGPRTGGLFDVTVGPLVDVWGFGGERQAVPDPAALERARALVDASRLEIDTVGGRVRLASPGMRLDLGGVAKGYAIDRAARVLEERGVAAGLVEVGGDVRVIGERPGGGPWRVGVQHPREQGALLGVLHLRDQAVATSGDYQRYFFQDGVRYHHILDPRTGWPGREAMSVTVVAGSVVEADILSTAVFLMEARRGLEVLEAWPGVEGIIVDARGAVLVTSGLQNREELPFFERR